MNEPLDYPYDFDGFFSLDESDDACGYDEVLSNLLDDEIDLLVD